MVNKKDETISIRVTCRGDKDKWTEFIHKIRMNRRKKKIKETVWSILEKSIDAYLKNE